MGLISSLDDAGELHILMLKLCGLVAFDGRSLDYPPTVLLSFYMHISHCLISSMYVWKFVALSRQQVYNVEMVAGCIGLCGVHLRYVIFFVHRRFIAKILETGRKLWFELADQERRIVVSDFISKSLWIMYFYLSSNLMMCVFFLGVSQLAPPPAEPNGTVRRILPYPFYADVQETPWYELSVALQMVSILGSSFSVSGYDTAPPFFVMLACGCLRALCYRLENLGLHCEAGPLALTRCILYHQQIIDYCKNVEKLTKSLFMVQLISTTYNMSLIGLELVGDDPGKVRFVPVLLLLGTQFFMCQWAPDVLVFESGNLAKYAYMVPTPGEDRRLVKLVHILLMRSQRAIQLTASGFVNLSLECFGSMITSALSFFTVLRSIHY